MLNFPPYPQDQACIGLLGLAFDANSSYQHGAALAPAAIREAFFCQSSNLWTEAGIDLGMGGIFADFGDIIPTQAEMVTEVEAAASRLYASGLKVMALGGDHSVTYPLVRAAANFHSNLTILHFDAHPDLYAEFDGNPYSHASPFARIMESRLARRLVQVGIRTLNRHQQQQAEKHGVEIYTMHNWQEVLNSSLAEPVYVSFDMDCLDPAFAPGVAHREPGGLSTREALSVIQSLKTNVVGGDLVELNPLQDPSGMTAMVAVKVFKEIVSMMLEVIK